MNHPLLQTISTDKTQITTVTTTATICRNKTYTYNNL